MNNRHYVGAHSDKHLLYALWENRDSLLVDKKTFTQDLIKNYDEMKRFGIEKEMSKYFLPPYEWYNVKIVEWTEDLGLKLISFTPGTKSNADYTIPSMKEKYISSNEIYNSILEFEEDSPNGLNGFHLLLHVGTDPQREDKFYYKLGELLDELVKRGYSFKLFFN